MRWELSPSATDVTQRTGLKFKLGLGQPLSRVVIIR